MRKLIIIVLCSTAVLLSGYAGVRGYKVWKQRHMVTLAREFLEKSDTKNAILCLTQVLQTNPRNLEASRMMAAFCEAAHSPSALLWRSRILESNPRSLDDRLALVAAALNARDLATATNALAVVDEAGRKTSEYHRVAGALAIATGNLPEAELQFKEIARLNPKDPLPLFNLAVLHLSGTNASAITDARASLNTLSSNPTNSALRCLALRELVSDAARSKKFDSAITLSKQLLQETNSLFSDKLVQLAVFQAAKKPEFTGSLASCQREAASSARKIYELAYWQMTQMSPGDALSWMKTLPASVQTNQPAALLSAECRNSMHDWQGLDTSLAKQNWSELEFIRLALRTRALRGMDMGSTASIEWQQALKAANNEKQAMVTLLRLAAQWNWISDAEDILRTIVQRFPNEQWAAQALLQSYVLNGQTRPLFALLTEEAAKFPANLLIKNNLAMIGLLLDAREIKPHQLAKEVYTKSPTNISFASTYALSLLLQGKNSEALKTFEQLNPKDLEDPSISGYYGMALQATGNKVKARKYLNLTGKARLLPEERKLFDKANAGI